MLDIEDLHQTIKQLNEVVVIMKRNTAMMSLLVGPQKPLMRLMIKLNLVKDWLKPF